MNRASNGNKLLINLKSIKMNINTSLIVSAINAKITNDFNQAGFIDSVLETSNNYHANLKPSTQVRFSDIDDLHDMLFGAFNSSNDFAGFCANNCANSVIDYLIGIDVA